MGRYISSHKNQFGITGLLYNMVCIPSGLAVEESPDRLLASIVTSHKSGDRDAVVGLLCGCVKTLRMQRFKPDPGIYLSLLYLVKKQHEYQEYFTAR